MVDPRIAHLIDARALLALLPHLDQSDLPTIRQEFARFLTRPRSRQSYVTWQEAWNAWTASTPHRPGRIDYTPVRCHACGGKGFNHRNVARNLSRTGHPMVCGECRGTRRGQRTTVSALYAPVPESDADTAP